MIVVGIDPGTSSANKLGYAILEREDSGNIFPHVYGTFSRSYKERSRRIIEISQDLAAFLRRSVKIEAIAIEKAYVGKHASAALAMGESRGSVFSIAGMFNIPVYEYEATIVKKSISGTGKAGKDHVAFMVRAILGLNETPQKDAADALAVGFCHLSRVHILGRK
jgi:crossover junction endodeoxyribonuclease RuvC